MIVGSKEIKVDKKKDGEGVPRRHYSCVDRLVERPDETVATVWDIGLYAAKEHGDHEAFGERQIIDEISEEKEVTKSVGGKETKEKKKWTYFKLGPYSFWSYKEFVTMAKEVGSGLAQLGLSKSTNFNLYSSTQRDWNLVAYGCMSQNIPFYTAYDSLGAEGLEHALNEPECVAMFTNGSLLKTVAEVVKNVKSLKYLIHNKPQKTDGEYLKKIKEVLPDLKILTLDELRQNGRDHKAEPKPPKPEDVCTVMYTSGSTGAPKGVILTHANLVASIGGVKLALGHCIGTGDSYIAYLPLAHVLEFIVEQSMIYFGIPMGYGTVKTLTDTSVRGCAGDIREFKPTVMAGVPAVWELIRKGIVKKINDAGGLKKSLFSMATTYKGAALKYNLPYGLVDRVVFKQVKEGTGGRLRYAISGGAPISKETQEFLSCALVTILQGYGMTESCGMCSVLPPEFFQYQSTGLPVPSIEVKLVDVPDAGYRHTDKPNPRGEVCIRGPSVTKGYFKREKETKETITDDGWLQTGDVGEWLKDGTLRIIDRKKNLVKLAGGEYLALEKMESVYKSCNCVANLCIYADPSKSYAIAIIQVNPDHIKALAKENGITDSEVADLVKSDKLHSAVLKELNATGKKGGLTQIEMLGAVVLVPDEWTAENGLLTAASKIKRKAIEEKYQKQIEKAY